MKEICLIDRRTKCIHIYKHQADTTDTKYTPTDLQYTHMTQWLRGGASDSRLRELGFKSCAAGLKSLGNVFTLHCFSLLSCINEYLAIDSGGYVYEQPSHIKCSMWLDASQRS